VVLGAINNSKTSTAKQDMTVVAEALNRYAADHDGQFPTSGSGWQELKPGSSVVSALVTNSSSTSYLQDIPTDPWDSSKHFWYYSSGTGFELITDTAKGDGGSGYKHLYMSNRMSTPTDQPPVTDPINDHSW
jgi:general secretion pathway protein G